ncbi:MAG TPA: DUF3011 domain-containing protein [Luteimonas sp.]|nr:DUF3011 domain-containing protein [Luteimonas sp.]
MNRSLHAALLCLASAVAIAVAAPATAAPPTARAYAPENLRSLSRDDQARVIGLEYSEQSHGRRIPDDQLRFYLDQVDRSNWGFSQVKQDIARSLGGSGGTWPPGGDDNRIRCESDDGRARTCPTPWQGGSRLVRQLSDTACIEGRTWQSQRGQVYVGGGCRGEFAAGAQAYPPVGGGSIRCESDDNRPRACTTPWQDGSRLVRQLSGTACIEGRTWQSRRGQVHVSGGCRGEFAAAGMGGAYPGIGNGYSVTCSSTDSRPQSCAWNSRYGRPYLLQQLSSSPCREGGSWRYDGNAIWVSNGCRARFGTR